MKPAIGSQWLARDGRRMRVDSVIERVGNGEPYAILTVLNPRPRSRRETRMGLSNFSDEKWSAFLSPLNPDDTEGTLCLVDTEHGIALNRLDF